MEHIGDTWSVRPEQWDVERWNRHDCIINLWKWDH
jgi:hypothetical protein